MTSGGLQSCRWRRTRRWPLNVLAISMLARGALAQAPCDPSRSVALEIDGARDAATAQRLARHVAAELGSNDLGVCTAAAPVQLGHVRIRSLSAELQRASIWVRAAGEAPVERELDVGSLPAEVRPLAIASATDELLRSVLFVTKGREARAPDPDPSGSQTDEDGAAAPVASETPTDAAPMRVALGMGGSASTFISQREAAGADLVARWWPMPRLAVTGRAGFAVRLSRPSERGSVQAEDDLHAGLDVGFELVPDAEWFGLIAAAGLNVARVDFDEVITGNAASLGPEGVPQYSDYVTGPDPFGHAWGIFGNLGAEARVRAGLVGLSVALALIVPLAPAQSDWSPTSLNQAGAEARAGFWVALAGEP